MHSWQEEATKKRIRTRGKRGKCTARERSLFKYLKLMNSSHEEVTEQAMEKEGVASMKKTSFTHGSYFWGLPYSRNHEPIFEFSWIFEIHNLAQTNR